MAIACLAIAAVSTMSSGCGDNGDDEPNTDVREGGDIANGDMSEGEVADRRDTSGLNDEEMIACQNDDQACPSPEDPDILCCPVDERGGDCNCANLGGADLPDDRLGCPSVCDAHTDRRPSRDEYGCMKLSSGDSCSIDEDL